MPIGQQKTPDQFFLPLEVRAYLRKFLTCRLHGRRAERCLQQGLVETR
jgi:hypothetical protein